MNDRLDAAFSARCRAASRWLGGAALATGALVLVGWALDLPALKSILPGFVSMKANTAIAVALCGGGLRSLAAAREGDIRAQWGLVAAASLVMLIGALTLGEYVFGANLRIDELLFADPDGGSLTSSPGRMGSNTALSFLCLGGALLLLRGEARRVRGAQALIIVAAAIALLAMVGYAYRAEFLYGIGRHTRMAVHTAVVLGAISIGAMLARPDAGVMAIAASRYAGGLQARKLWPAAIASPVLLGELVLLSRRSGLHDTGLDVPLLVVLDALAMSTVTLWAARSLNLTDEARQQGEEEHQAQLRARVVAEEAARAQAERLQRVEAEGRLYLATAVDQYLGFVRQVAGGDLAQRLAVSGEGALGALGAELNGMVSSIEASFRKEQEAQAEASRLKEEIIRVQQAMLDQLSTPLVPISERVVAMPLIGAIDRKRAERVLETLLAGVVAHGAEAAILDVTGVPVVDAEVASGLLRAAHGVRLLGAEVVLTGIRPEVARTLVDLGADLGNLATRSSLQRGIEYAMRGRPGTPAARH
jgi:anti-anti-sigma regulatory factor/predicted RNA-binding protein with PIN domain